jgi:hypothetical protein
MVGPIPRIFAPWLNFLRVANIGQPCNIRDPKKNHGPANDGSHEKASLEGVHK